MSNKTFLLTLLGAATLGSLITAGNAQTGRIEQRSRTAPIALPTFSVGFFKSVGGLSMETEVVDYKEGGVTGVVRRVPGNPQGSSFRVGLAGPSGFYDWFEDFFAGKRASRSGAVRASDPTGKVTAQVDFTNALLTEVSFPTLQVGVVERGYFGVVFAPEKQERREPSGQAAIYRDPNARQKKNWMINKFQVKVGNLPTGKVAKVDGFTVKQAHVYQHNQTDLEFLLIRFHVPESEMSRWPVKASSPNLKAGGNEVAIETLEIAHEGLNICSLELLNTDGDRLARLEFRAKDLRAAAAPVNGMRSLSMQVSKLRFRKD